MMSYFNGESIKLGKVKVLFTINASEVMSAIKSNGSIPVCTPNQDINTLD